MMRHAAILAAIACVLLPLPVRADAITVAADSTAQYVTIQEGIDAAGLDDIVYVFAGTYDDLHWITLPGPVDLRVNVHVNKGIRVVNVGGPDRTIIDGGGTATAGVVVDHVGASIEGFTVENGCTTDPCAAIVVVNGQAHGNTCTGYHTGISAGYDSTVPERFLRPLGGRREMVLSNNIVRGNAYGVLVLPSASPSPMTVFENTVHDNDCGVFVSTPSGDIQLVGNSIIGNGTGVELWCGPSWPVGTAPLNVVFEGNLILNNASTNVDIWADEGHPDKVFTVTIGGTIEKANDILGSFANISARTTADVALTIDASFNYWGNTQCAAFVPRFHLDPSLDDEAFTFLPFTDDEHVTVYAECESTAVAPRSWGSVKASYR